MYWANIARWRRRRRARRAQQKLARNRTASSPATAQRKLSRKSTAHARTQQRGSPHSASALFTRCSTCAPQWFPLILDALMADKFVDFMDAFCEC